MIWWTHLIIGTKDNFTEIAIVMQTLSVHEFVSGTYQYFIEFVVFEHVCVCPWCFSLSLFLPQTQWTTKWNSGSEKKKKNKHIPLIYFAIISTQNWNQMRDEMVYWWWFVGRICCHAKKKKEKKQRKIV